MHISQIGAGARVRVVHSLEHTKEALASYLAVPGEYQEGGRGRAFQKVFRNEFFGSVLSL